MTAGASGRVTNRTLMLVTVEIAEIVVRMVEARAKMKRPDGFTADEIVESLPPDVREDLLREAHAVADYFTDCCSGLVHIGRMH